MRGYPEHLNTKQDYFNMLEIDPKETVRRLELLLLDRFIWTEERALNDDEAGIEDETHQVRTYYILNPDQNPEKSDEVIEQRFQYRREETEYCQLHRLGFTVDEIEKLISDHQINDIMNDHDGGGGSDVYNI